MSIADEFGGAVRDYNNKKFSRTHLAITNEAKANDNLRHSEFMITINPNKTFPTPKSAGFQDMIKRLTTMGDFILEDKNLVRLLKFNDDTLTPEKNIKLISQIDPNRLASVEYGSKTHRLHLHISFFIKHKTKLMIDRAKLEKVASSLLDIDKKQLHINIQVSGVPSFREYVKKNIPKLV